MSALESNAVLSTPDKPVTEFWYALQPCANDIVRLREVHVDPYAAGDIWLVRGSRVNLVIDTGSGIVPLLPVIEAISDKPILAIALNNACGHAGGWSGFDNRACHRSDAAGLRNPGRQGSMAYDYLTDSSLTALPRHGYSARKYQMVGAEPTSLIHDGDSIDLGGRNLEVMHVPGRGTGGIALWEAESGSLFTGDMLYDCDHDLAWPPDNPALYTASLWQFRSLPVNVVYAGHYGSFDGARMIEIIDGQLLDLNRC